MDHWLIRQAKPNEKCSKFSEHGGSRDFLKRCQNQNASRQNNDQQTSNVYDHEDQSRNTTLVLNQMPNLIDSEGTTIKTTLTATEDVNLNDQNSNSQSPSLDLSGSDDLPSNVTVNNKKRKYSTKFRADWKNTYPWLVEEASLKGKKCFVCNISIVGGKSHLERHNSTEGHKKSWERSNQTLKITNFAKSTDEETKICDAAKKLEISLSLFIADHNLPFKSLDHLNLLLKTGIPDSKVVKKLSINRIKAQSIIKNITGPSNLENIIDLINKQYYSLIIDESTDCSSSKNLALIVRIFQGKCQDRFLGLVPLSDSTAQGIYDSIMQFLKLHNINLENMIGFTADNCSVMMGKINGVQSKLKQVLPKLFVNGCVCHNINLVSMAAASELPDEIDKLIREINHHFCNSPSRKEEFRKYQEYFGTELHTILRYASTRWLSRQYAINRLLEQWNTLSYYFEFTSFESNYGNENVMFISNMLKSPIIKLYFLFLSYILDIINSVNLEMQSEQPRMHVFIPRLTSLFKQICRNFIRKSSMDSVPIKLINLKENHLSDNDLYCGAQVELFCQETAISTITEFKTKVRKFYIKFCENLRTKIDFENEVLNFLPKFTPEHVLSGNSNSILRLLQLLFSDKELQISEKINSEFRALADYEELKKLKENNISDFWNSVGSFKNEVDQFVFENIYRIAQGILSLPHSSANVERIFSIQNLVKTKCRNRLAVSTCEALIQTKDLLKANHCSCYNFKIPVEMLSRNIKSQVTEDELLVEE